jgi:transposase
MAKKPTLKKFKEAVEQYGGCISDIAKAMKVSRGTVHNWINGDPEFKNEIEKGNDVLLDLAKSALKSLLENKSERAVLYTLDRLGRKEGFGQFIQIQDKSKLDEQLDEMSNDEILAEMERSRQRIAKANGKG